MIAANLVLLAPIPDELVERIQGQVSDLNWQVTLLASTPESAANPWTSIQSRTASTAVDIAVWVETSTQNVDGLSIFEPSSGQLKVKTIAHAAKLTKAKRSANYEALALTVRSHVQAFEMRSRMVTLSPPKLVPIRTKKPAVEREPVVPNPSYWETHVAPFYILQTDESFRDIGLLFGLAWGRDRWRISFRSAGTLPVELSDEYSKLTLWSAQVQLGAEWIVSKSVRDSISLGFQSGPQVFVGRAEAVLETVQADEVAFVWSIRSALGAAWTKYFNSLSEGWGLRLGFELGVVAGAPQYRYQSADTTVVRSEVWVFQPQLSVGLTYGKKSN